MYIYESVAQKIPVGDVLSGRVAPKFVERQLRPWVGEIPILRGLMRDKNSYWKFEKTGIDNADVRGEKFDAEAFRREAADAVSATAQQAREGLMLGYESPEMLARRVGNQPKFDLDAPFYVDEAQKRFADSSEFSDWVRAVDSGAEEEFARLSDLPDAAKIWREEYLPAYAQRYGVRVGDVNAVVRSGDALDAARVRKMIDSIPDEEESLKLEAIGDANIAQLYENRLGIEYQTAFERKINVEFGKAKRGGEPSAALMVAAHEIMHAVDDIRADGSRLGKHSGGTLGAIVGEIPKCLTAVSKIRGWGDVLTPEIRKSISKCADFAAGKRPKNPEKLKEWRKYRNDYRQKELERFCAENRILTREVAVKELNEVIAWWQGLPSADMVGKYFQQPWERFAEAGAAFLCNTKMFAKLAPNVYEAMLGNMRARPKFWQNWQEFQRRLDNPQGNARRTAETVKRGFVEARLADVAYTKSVRKADLAYLRQDLKTYYRTENAPLYDFAEKLAKRNGGRAYDAYGLIADFHDYRYAATFQEAYMARVARVYEKLAQNKIDLDDFDAALLCLRIDQGRADIANPYGITPKRARAVFSEIMGGDCEPARLAFREAIRLRAALRREFVVRPLVELKAFDEKTNGILLENNSYAKIERSKAGEPAKPNLELLMKGMYGDSCGGLIMRQFGTLAAVKSPSAATLEKDLRAIAFVKSQKAIRAVADVCLKMDIGREADTEAAYNRDGTFRANVPKIIDNDRVKTLIVLENGAARGVYVPAYLANVIIRSGGGSMARVLEGLSNANYAVKSVLVQYNFMAWGVLHIRDVLHELRAVSMLGSGIADSLAQCLKLASKFPAAYPPACGQVHRSVGRGRSGGRAARAGGRCRRRGAEDAIAARDCCRCDVARRRR